MTCCSTAERLPERRWRDEPAHASSGTCQCEAVLQGAAHAGHRGQLRAIVGAGDQRTTQSQRGSGSLAGDGSRRTRPPRHSKAHSRCQAARLKTLEEFDFNQARQIPAAKIRELAEGGYIERAEPVVLMGECGTGKTHLATGLCVAACRQKRRARFTTAANLVNELVEARQHNAVKRVLARWLRYDVIVLDEVGYVPLAEIGAEFLFQVIAERAERATLIVTTNLPFSEWTQVFPNPRLCKALLDRITDRAHIIETGTESYRFRRTVEGRQKKRAS